MSEPIDGPFRLAPEADSCGNCVFFFNPSSAQCGLCRRMPPIALLVGTQTTMVGQVNAITQAAYPPLDPTAWCGEHRRRP